MAPLLDPPMFVQQNSALTDSVKIIPVTGGLLTRSARFYLLDKVNDRISSISGQAIQRDNVER